MRNTDRVLYRKEAERLLRHMPDDELARFWMGEAPAGRDNMIDALLEGWLDELEDEQLRSFVDARHEHWNATRQRWVTNYAWMEK